MGAPVCQFEYKRFEQNGRCSAISCSVVNERVGVACTFTPDYCERCGERKDGDKTINQVVRGLLRARLVRGNSRAFRHSVDVPDTAKRFRAEATTEEDWKLVVKQAIKFQCVLPDNGGKEAAAVLLNLRELEAALDVAGVLEAEKVRNAEDVETRQWEHDELGPDTPCGGCGK